VIVAERLVTPTIRSRSLAALLPLAALLAVIRRAAARVAGWRTGRYSLDGSGDGGDS
jgi:hypothetical protein